MTVGLTAHWRAMGAIVRRDFAIFMSYRGRLVEQVLASVGMILIFNFTAKLVNVPQFKSHGDYFAFVVVGIVSLLTLQYLVGAASTLVLPPYSDLLEYVSASNRALSFAPAHEQERCAVSAVGSRIVGECRDGVGLAIRRTKRRRTPVHLLVTA